MAVLVLGSTEVTARRSSFLTSQDEDALLALIHLKGREGEGLTNLSVCGSVWCSATEVVLADFRRVHHE